MTGKRTRFTPNEKVCTVLQMFNPKTNRAELRRRRNLATRTVYAGKERFLEGGRISSEGANSGRRELCQQGGVKPQEDHRGICRGNRGLKKNAGEKHRMSADVMMRDVVGFNMFLRLCGVSKKMYYKPRPRDIPLDQAGRDTIRKISPRRPAYSTRCMAARRQGS